MNLDETQAPGFAQGIDMSLKTVLILHVCIHSEELPSSYCPLSLNEPDTRL